MSSELYKQFTSSQKTKNTEPQKKTNSNVSGKSNLYNDFMSKGKPKEVQKATITDPVLSDPKVQKDLKNIEKESFFSRYMSFVDKGGKLASAIPRYLGKTIEETTKLGTILDQEIKRGLPTPKEVVDSAKYMGQSTKNLGTGFYDFFTKQAPKAVATVLSAGLEMPGEKGILFETEGMKNKREKAGKFFNDVANNLDKELKQRQVELGTDGDTSIFDPAKFFYTLGSGAGSMALGVGAAVLTKSKVAGGIALGLIEGSDTYQEAKQNFRAKYPDMSEDDIEGKAFAFMLLDSAGIAYLEKVGLDFLFRSYAGGALYNRAINAITETAQEEAQTVWSGLVGKYGYDKQQDLIKEMVEVAVTTPFLGMLGGSAAQQKSLSTSLDVVRQRIKTSESFNVEESIKQDPTIADKIYQDPENKILTKEFAQGRVDDVAQKADMYKSGLGDEVRSKIDVNNTTMNEIVETGLNVVESAETNAIDFDLDVQLVDEVEKKMGLEREDAEALVETTKPLIDQYIDENVATGKVFQEEQQKKQALDEDIIEAIEKTDEETVVESLTERFEITEEQAKEMVENAKETIIPGIEDKQILKDLEAVDAEIRGAEQVQVPEEMTDEEREIKAEVEWENNPIYAERVGVLEDEITELEKSLKTEKDKELKKNIQQQIDDKRAEVNKIYGDFIAIWDTQEQTAEALLEQETETAEEAPEKKQKPAKSKQEDFELKYIVGQYGGDKADTFYVQEFFKSTTGERNKIGKDVFTSKVFEEAVTKADELNKQPEIKTPIEDQAEKARELATKQQEQRAHKEKNKKTGKEKSKKSDKAIEGWTAGALDTIWTKDTNSPKNGYLVIFALDDNAENKGTFRVSVNDKIVQNEDGEDRLFNSLEEAIEFANGIEKAKKDAEEVSENPVFIENQFYREDSLGETEQYGYELKMTIGTDEVGNVKSYRNEDNEAISDFEIYEQFQRKGYGSILLLEQIKRDIDVFGGHFIDSRGLTKAMEALYDSLENKGLITSLGLGAYTVDKTDDKADNVDNDTNTRPTTDTTGLSEAVRNGEDESRRAREDSSKLGKSKRRKSGKLPLGSSESGNGLATRLTNEEIEEKLKSVTELSATGEVSLTAEITDEIKEAIAQYVPGGTTKSGRGILDEYYTNSQIVDLVKSLFSYEKKNMKVLEPSVGTGNFLYALPELNEHNVIGIEISDITARIAKVLHPEARIFKSQFESIFVDDRGEKRQFKTDFDLVLGNPPYGEHRGEYLGLGEEKGIKKYEEYFLKRGVDLLKDGGYLAMVVPSGFLRSKKTGDAKESIANNAELVNAFRLPNGAFESTDIGTDIVIFKKSDSKDVSTEKSRLSLLSDDNFFKANPDNVLGTTETRKNKFGQDEEFVSGTIEDAISLFYNNQNNVEAIKLLEDLNLEVTPENIEQAETALEETSTPESAKEIVKEAKKPTKQATKTISKIKQTSDIKGEATSLTGQFGGQFTEAELAAWKDTQYDGTLNNIEIHLDLASYYKGKWYIDFNYAQGDIYEKLEQLERDKNKIEDSQYSKQKALLESVLPKRELITDITLSPNSDFVKNTKFSDEKEAPALREMFLKWVQDLPRGSFFGSNNWEVRAYVLNEQVRGSDKDLNEKVRVRRKSASENLFNKFLSELSVEDQKTLEDIYNKTFNFYYSPDYKKVPMFAEVSSVFKGKPLEIRDVQKHGIGRLVNTGVGILAHDVGFGKTMSGILALHETMSRGWAKKPIIVVPSDNVYAQWVDTISELVPNAKFNLLGNLGTSFKGDLSSLKIEDGSITIVTYEGFKRLSFKDSTYESFGNKFKYISDDLKTHKTERERQKDKAKAMEFGGKMKRGTRADLYFEDLGFDHITFDEVHNANHIVSKVKLEKGQASEFNRFALKPSDIGIKTWLAAQYIQQMQDGRNVNLLSATPFTNHPLEYYSILSLVADESLQKMGLSNVNEFFNTFMEAENEYEFKADGTYQRKTDVRGIKNLRQFRRLLDTYIDFKEGDAEGIIRPDRIQKTYEIPQNGLGLEMEEKAQAIFKENEREAGKGAKTLRAIGELRKIAFSPYASQFAPTLSGKDAYKTFVDNSPKIKTLMGLLAQNKQDNPETGQIVYVDSVGVDFLPYIKEYLIKESGYQSTEVEIITGATDKKKRSEIQANFNNGDVKILLGSEAIKEGINLQENTTDLYVLSLPWNFTQLRQVIGRAWRQGNKWKNVRINNLFIQDSIDVFLSQKLENKQKRYESAWKSGENKVDIGDVSFNELKFDLIRDPVTRANLELSAEKERLDQQLTQEKAELSYATRKADSLNQKIEAVKDVQVQLDRELKLRDEATEKKQEFDEYWITAYGDRLKKAKEALNEEKAILAERGIDIESLTAIQANGQKKIEALEAEIKGLSEQFEDKVKELAASMPQRKEFSEEVVTAFVAERAEDNKTFYELRQDTKEVEVVIAEVEPTVDERLVPADKVFYHGTLEQFDEFDLKKVGENTAWDNASFGFFFIESKARAEKFVEDTKDPADKRPVAVKEVYLDIKNPIDFTFHGILTKTEQAGVIYEMLTGKKAKSNEKALKFLDDSIDLGTVSDFFEALYGDIENKNFLQSKGYDGIVSEFGRDDDGEIVLEYVAFEPSQIKIISKPADKKVIAKKKRAVVTEKKAKPVVKAKAKKQTTKERELIKIITSKQITASEKVDILLDKKQEGKAYRDAGDRVTGSKKEKATIKLVLEHGDSDTLRAFANELGVDPMLQELNKQTILAEVAVPTVESEKAKKTPAYIANYKINVLNRIGRVPTVVETKGKYSRHQVVPDDLIDKFLAQYPGALQTFVTELSNISTLEELNAFSEKYKYNFMEIDKGDGDMRSIGSEVLGKNFFRVLRAQNVSARGSFTTESGYYSSVVDNLERYNDVIDIIEKTEDGILEKLSDYTENTRFYVPTQYGSKVQSFETKAEAQDYLKEQVEDKTVAQYLEERKQEAEEFIKDVNENYEKFLQVKEVGKTKQIKDAEAKVKSITEGIERFKEEMEKDPESTWFSPKRLADYEADLETAKSYLNRLTGGEKALTHGNFEEIAQYDVKDSRFKKDFVTTENLMRVYGFKSTQLGNYMDDQSSKEHIVQTMAAMEDMSKITGVDFAKLNQSMGLSIAFGARGGSGALAHFEPKHKIINLTKKKGDGSFGHEYMHALDYILGSKTYRGKWSSTAKSRYYSGISEDLITKRISQALLTGVSTDTTTTFEVSDELKRGYAEEIIELREQGKTIEEAIEWVSEESGRRSEYRYPTYFQAIADVYRKPVTATYKTNSNKYYLDSLRYAGGKTTSYWVRLEELWARAFQAYLEDKMLENGIKNSYLTRSTLDHPVYPQGTERVEYNKMFDELFAILGRDFPVPESISEPRFKLSEQTTPVEENVLTDAGAYLENLKTRLGIDFDVVFVDTILAQKQINPVSKQITGIQRADGAYIDNTIVLTKNMARHTAEHETVHLTLANMDKIKVFAKNGLSQEKVMEAQASELGIKWTEDTHVQIEEALAQGFEKYVEGDTTTPAPQGIIARFFELLKKLITQFAELVGITKADVIKNYYDVLSEAETNEQEIVRLENRGLVESFIDNGILDGESIGVMLRTSQALPMETKKAKAIADALAENSDNRAEQNRILDALTDEELAQLAKSSEAGRVQSAIEQMVARQYDYVQGEVLKEDIKFKIKNEDKRATDLKLKFNELVDLQERYETDMAKWKADIGNAINRQVDLATQLKEADEKIKELSRFTKRKPPRVLTERGEKELESLQFENPQAVVEEVSDYLTRKTELVTTRNELRQLKKQIANLRKDDKAGRAELREVERKLRQRKEFLERKNYYVDMGRKRGMDEQMKVIRNRGRLIKSIQEVFTLGDSKIKPLIGGRKIHLMSEREFDNFILEFVNKAQKLSDTLSVQDEIKALEQAQQFSKLDNLRKAMGLPTIDKMKEVDARRFLRVLQKYSFGDTFLTKRQIETVHRTAWGEVKTEREVLEKLKENVGVGALELKTIKTPRQNGDFTAWIRLARSHPFFNWLVGKRVEATIKAEREINSIEEEVNALARKARASRRKMMTPAQRVKEVLVPTDDIVFGFLEAEDKEEYKQANNMTKEELAFADYLTKLYYDAYIYLNSEYGVRGRKNYVTHIRRSFFETLKDSGIKEAFSELVTSQKEDEAAFKILDDKTGEILAFEKFFGYAMKRTGALIPTKNVARASMAYFTALAKKKALDEFIPEVMVAVQAHKSVADYTEKGLEKDPTFEAFVKTFLNDAKGRKVKFVTSQGSSLDIGVRAMISWVAIKYLGLNLATAIASFVGETVVALWELSTKEALVGVARSLNVPKAYKVNKQFQYFTGRNPIVEMFDSQYNTPQTMLKAIMVLMGIAPYQTNKFFLRAKMTQEEWNTGVIEDKRLKEIALSLSRAKPNKFYIKSLAGNTTVGGATFQFGSWAVSIFNTVTSDAAEVLKMLKDKKGWETMKTKEFQKLAKFAIMAGVATFVATLIGADDDDDDSYLAKLIQRAKREMTTLSQALLFVTDPTNYGLIIKEFAMWTEVVPQFISGEKYKMDGVGYKQGDSKWVRTLERAFIPNMIKNLNPPQEEDLLQSLLQDAVKSGDFDPAYIADMVYAEDMAKQEAKLKPKEFEAYILKKQKDVTVQYNLLKNHSDNVVSEIVNSSNNNDEKVMELLALSSEIGIDKVSEAMREIKNDKNLCTNPSEKTGCLVSDNLYDNWRKQANKYTKNPEELANFELPEKVESVEEAEGLIETVALYAQAIGTDLPTAFNRMFTNQRIRRIDNGTIIIERNTGTFGTDTEFSTEQREELGATDEMFLDHTVPIQLGGADSKKNVKLVTRSEWESYTPVENHLGKLLRSGKINKVQAQDYILRFKNGEISKDEVLKLN